MDHQETIIGDLVGAVAEATGLTVRTLHHWDAAGVASPSRRTAAGYRAYSSSDIERVRRVQRYRQLGIPLENIRVLLMGSANDRRELLEQHRVVVAAGIDDLQSTMKTLERLSAADEQGPLLSSAEQTDVLGEGWNPDRTQEARARWGDTPQWTEWAERAADRSSEDWRAITAGMTEATETAAEALRAGVDPQSATGVEVAERHRSAMSKYFTCSPSMHMLITRRFSDEAGFVEHHDRFEHGLGAWLRSAAEEAARQHGIDPTEARWE